MILYNWLRNFILGYFRLLKFRKAIWLAKDKCRDVEQQSLYTPKTPYTLGIIKEFWHCHWPYIAACRDLGIAYKVIDISGPDWIDVVRESECDAFLVWPSVHMSIWKEMFDERLRIMTEELDKTIYPDYKSTWIYESKRKMHYWLQANNIPHPKTWIFYDIDDALDFAEKVKLPIVFKSDFGSGASGVKIFRHRAPLIRFVKRCFKRGYVRPRSYPLDKQWGSVLLQEYLPRVKEWRMIRIGDSYFGYEKIKKGDFHSGSHCWNYSKPKDDLLEFIRNITNIGNFLSMDLDIFETQDSRYLVNELQTVCGMGNPYEMCVVDGKHGRMCFDAKTKSWRFEAGEFCQHYLCNQRVLALLNLLNDVKSGSD